MGEFANRILGMLPEVRREHRAREQEEARIQAAKHAEAARAEMQRNEDAKRATSLGKEVAGLLERHRVPKLPIYDRTNGGLYPNPVRKVGEGWHVARIGVYMGADTPTSSALFGLSENGRCFEFRNTQFQGGSASGDEEKLFKGILFTRTFEGSEAMRMIENPTFQRGVAWLIETHQPYDDRNVYDY